ncbi:MAG: porin [Candidatus Hydrogenedentota bacterium]
MLRPFKTTFALAAILTILASPTMALDINGNLIVEYRNREGGTGLIAGTQHDQFRLVQTTLRLTHDFTDYNRFGASITSGQGGAVAVTEGWAELGGLPYNGVLTLGRFYKPLAAPYQTVGLSYPALLFHTNPVLGAKVGMDFYPWRWEVGLVNNYDLSLTGTTISNSPAMARPIVVAGAGEHIKEVYSYLGWRDGGSWGSLDASAGFSYGSFNIRDRALFNTIAGFVPGSQNDRSDRYLYEFSADYTYGPYRVSGDYARSREGRFAMTVYNVTGGYRWGKYNFLVGYDHLTNNANVRLTSTPATWERDRVTYGINYEWHPNVTLALEYEDNREDITTVSAERRQAKDGIENDGLVFQINASF